MQSAGNTFKKYYRIFLLIPATIYFAGSCLRLYQVNLVDSTLQGNDPMTSHPAIPDNLYYALRDIIHNARTQAYRAVNHAMVEVYWKILQPTGTVVLGNTSQKIADRL